MAENPEYYAEVAEVEVDYEYYAKEFLKEKSKDESPVYYAEAEDDHFHGYALGMLLAVQGVVWFSIGFTIGLWW